MSKLTLVALEARLPNFKWAHINGSNPYYLGKSKHEKKLELYVLGHSAPSFKLRFGRELLYEGDSASLNLGVQSLLRWAITTTRIYLRATHDINPKAERWPTYYYKGLRWGMRGYKHYYAYLNPRITVWNAVGVLPGLSIREVDSVNYASKYYVSLVLIVGDRLELVYEGSTEEPLPLIKQLVLRYARTLLLSLGG